MTVVFGVPSAEQVTITPGVPLSSTGRISDGRRVITISFLHRWNEAGPCPWSWRLQIYLAHLEFDSQRRGRHKRAENVFGGVGQQRPHAPHETSTDAFHTFGVIVLDCTMVQVVTFELIRLMRGKLFYSDG